MVYINQASFGNFRTLDKDWLYEECKNNLKHMENHENLNK